MTMHLAHPSLTTTGKKKGKKKWASAEAKRRSEKAVAEREAMLREYNIRPPEQKCHKSPDLKPKEMHPRYQDHLKQEITSHTPGLGVCSKPPERKYSGERQLIGIATMHKSNMVPIFADNKEVAIDIARMRRG